MIKHTLQENIETKLFAESFGGILICGINWGGKQTDLVEIKNAQKSFFSDPIYKGKFHDRILKWFELWGHPLSSNETDRGKFEKSIAYTNWLSTKSPKFNGNIYNDCVSNRELFLNMIEYLRPELIFFLSIQLHKAFNSSECILTATKSLGEETKGKKFYPHEITFNNKKLKRFKVGFQSFENCEIVSLPHPSGSKGLADAYIESFKNEIGSVIEKWKSKNII